MSTSSKPALAPALPQEVRPLAYRDAGGPGEVEPSGVAGSAATREERAREAGRQEGETRARAVWDEQLAQVRQSVALALSGFAQERAQYYRTVEAEVVRLALSIARKILHREAQVDPLLLAGIVRVAMEKIESGTKVLVRVHPQQAAEWRDYFARGRDLRDVPEIVEDAALEPERCVLETVLGMTELGLEVQLKEIEQGLLDLLAQRPQAAL